MLLCAPTPPGKCFNNSPFSAFTTRKPLFVVFNQPARRHVEFLAVRCDARAVAAAIVLAFPKNFLRLNVECTKPPIRGGIINGVTFGIAAKSAQSFLEWNFDAPHELVSVIEVEHENPFARTALLCGVRRADVKITFERGVCRK